MKKNGKQRGNGSNESEGAAESLRNRKTYLNRLVEMGLEEPPVFKRAKMPSAIELARLAAALEKDSTNEVSAGDLAARAREIWKASADAPFVEEMGGFVVGGLCLFDKHDWTRHCHALIGLLDDAEGGVPGLRTGEYYVRSIRRARVRASMAAAEMWRRTEQTQRADEVIRTLFPAKSETEESRKRKLAELLEFARNKVVVPGQEEWALKYGIRVAATLIAAWMPLMVPPEDAKFVETAAMAWMDCPKAVEVSNLGASPVLARWLAVLRIQQLKGAKNRA
jgi:hypothetical protein